MAIDLIIILAFLAVNLWLGFVAGRDIETLDHFSVGHRSFKTFTIFATLTASFIGGGYTIGNAAKVYHMGMVYAFALLGFSLQQILVARFIAPRMDRFNRCLSIGDIVERGYGVKAKVVTGFFALIVCAGILGAQVGAMGAIFEQFFHLPSLFGILLGFGVIICYATLGGMKAVVYTDIMQFLILLIGLPLAFFLALNKAGGWTQVVSSVPHHHIHFLTSRHDYAFFATLFLTFIFGEALVPPYVQRLFMAKNSGHTQRGTMLAGLTSIPYFLIVGAIGLIAYCFDPTLDPNAALPYIVQHELPPFARGFVIAGILSVIMSSASGFLNSASVAIVNDIIRPLTGDSLSPKRLLSLAKWSTLVVGVLAIIFALAITNVLDILLYAYNFWSPIVLVPIVAVILDYRVGPRDFATGALAGSVMMVIWTWYLNEPYHLNGVVVGVFANLLAFILSYQLRLFQAGVDSPALVG